jgi:hypothetical protein
LALRVLRHAPPIFFLLNGLNLGLEVPCLVINGTRHHVLFLDVVPFGLLNLPHKLGISPYSDIMGIVSRVISLPRVIGLYQMGLSRVIVVPHYHVVESLACLVLFPLILVVIRTLFICCLSIQVPLSHRLQSMALCA